MEVKVRMSQEIYIIKSDKEKLIHIINKAISQELKPEAHLKGLETEINRAQVVEQQELSFKFIKMNSKVLMTVDQDEEEMTLVYPEEADIKKNKISVLSPIGTAILGYREGSCVEWKVPNGIVHIQIRNIIDC